MKKPGTDTGGALANAFFDAGTASGYFALQASKMGWFVHGMAGLMGTRPFRTESPEGYRAEAAYGLGGTVMLDLVGGAVAREKPSDRLPIKQLAFEGSFKADA